MASRRARAASGNNMDQMFPDQKKEVALDVLRSGIFTPTLANAEVDSFYHSLGLPSTYFENTSAADIAKHIQSLQAAKVLAEASGRPFDVQLAQETGDGAFFAVRSSIRDIREKASRVKEGTMAPTTRIERYIESKYMSARANTAEEGATGSVGIEKLYQTTASSEPDSLSYVPPNLADRRLFRLQAYRSAGALDPASKTHLRLYFLQAPEYVNPTPAAGESNIEEVGDKTFLASASAPLKEEVQSMMTEASSRLGPVIRVMPNSGHLVPDGDDDGDHVLMIAYHSGSTHSYFTGVSHVYRFYNFYATSKHVESFSNGMLVLMFSLRSLDAEASDEAERLAQVQRDANLHFTLPRTSITPLLAQRTFSAATAAYAYCAWKFAYHFLARGMTEYNTIARALKRLPRGAGGGEAMNTLARLRKSLITQSYTEGFILDVIFRNPETTKWLYADFCRRHDPRGAGSGEAATETDEALSQLKRRVPTEADLEVFSAMLKLNRYILKTNFFMAKPVALSFRLDPAFMNAEDYPDVPHGVFFVVGSEFRGFHIRFRNVARGGIRVVKSFNPQAFVNNVASMFDECYNLANTQQRKNKDIPEGGSKGVVLLNLAHQDKQEPAFQKYIDSLLDLMLPTELCRDHLGSEELLFLGPDENTADYMDWASLHARGRGYRYWKAFTTGKSPSMGGIPHDTYGMTTRSVRAYVEGIQRKLGLTAAECLKMQTGGPDGDLGSNEILLGKEKTMAVVDGSGVLFDPEGIDNEELLRLAKARKMVTHVDRSKISDRGFLVLCEDRDVTLPDGTTVENGTAFRNTFHLNPIATGDFFVPCGGRPAAVRAAHVKDFLYKPDGALRFKYVVEGANLFFTQDARLELENAGVVTFKDASANKGGVTSSSLEVLAALSLDDTEFAAMMTLTGESAPDFYKQYVEEVQDRIEKNAENEFECLWAEAERTGKPKSVLSDILSTKITNLSTAIEASDTLWANDALREKVLRAAVPKTLADAVGFETVVERLPESYMRALFASQLASKFIYSVGVETPEFAFYEYCDKLLSDSL